MTQWQPILVSVGIGIFVSVIWATMDAMTVHFFGEDQTYNRHITTAVAAANGAWLMWLWS